MQVRKISALRKPFGVDAATGARQKMARHRIDKAIARKAFFNVFFAQVFFCHIHKHSQPFNFGLCDVYNQLLAAIAASSAIYSSIHILINAVGHFVEHCATVMAKRAQKVVVFFFFFRSYCCNGLQIGFVCSI